MSTPYRLVLCTCPDHHTATSIARNLIDLSAAACVNILPAMTSIYRWQGRVEESTEHMIIIKTNKENYPELENILKQLHPYDVPEILAVDIADGLPEYLLWLDGSLNPQ